MAADKKKVQNLEKKLFFLGPSLRSSASSNSSWLIY